MKQSKLQISIRTVALTTACIGTMLGVFLKVPDDADYKFLAFLAAYLILCVVPLASVGYDRKKNSEGIVSGTMLGLGVAFVLAVVFLVIFAPRVHR